MSEQDVTQQQPEPAPVEEAAAEADSPGAGGADSPPVEVEHDHGHGGEAQAAEPAPAAAPQPAPATAPQPAPVDPLQEAQIKAAEYLELAQRKQAEFENFRRRMNTQIAAAEDKGVARLAKELLPALDHLELALEAAEKHVGAEEWVKGIRLVQEEVHGALGRVGIEPYVPFGEPFDPNEHDAMAQAPAGDREPGTVAEVYQAGYRLNGAVLRPARVVVAQ